jgi:predicted short-subunit dehydrogenase-like oxidoreductase (DUF2520 family)
MTAKPRISIVGPGNLGTALALSLRKAGYVVNSVVARRGALKKAKVLARQIGARAVTSPLELDSELVWFCVPDSEIAHAAAGLSKMSWKGKITFHSSGALTSGELALLRRKGAAVASVHPLMTFVRRPRPSLTGVSFAIEGDVRALRCARVIVRDLGGAPYSIRKEEKAAYHAWGTFASPLLTALLVTNERVAALAGVGPKMAKRRMLPILLQTLVNYAANDAENAFSGPIIRGDVETVRRHLSVLRKIPVAKDVYAALARAALEYLPAQNRQSLKRVLGLKRA